MFLQHGSEYLCVTIIHFCCFWQGNIVTVTLRERFIVPLENDSYELFLQVSACMISVNWVCLSEVLDTQTAKQAVHAVEEYTYSLFSH